MRFSFSSVFLKALLVCVWLFAPALHAAETRLQIDVRKPGPVFEGWGTSLAWWAERVGDWPDAKLAPLLRLITDPETGLGMNIFRFNIGAGENPAHHHMRRGAQIPGYRSGPGQPYDWAADPNQRRVLLQLARACSNAQFEAISYSPPWWMTLSGCTAGSTNGAPNIADVQIPAYAEYLAEVVAHFREEGITFRSLTPMNEPDENWWKAGGKQEGCGLSMDQQEKLLFATLDALRRKQIRDTVVSVTDGNGFERVLRSLRHFSPQARGRLAEITTHSYHEAGRAELRNFARQLKLPVRQSEAGPLGWNKAAFPTALGMAARVIHDLNELQPVDWLMWQVSEGANWGALGDFPDEQRFIVKDQFHTLRQFTRNIRPGDVLVPLGGEPVVAAFSKARGSLCVVLVNEKADPVSYQVEVLGTEGLPESATVTHVTESLRTVEPGRIQCIAGLFHIELAPRSLTAIRCEGVKF